MREGIYESLLTEALARTIEEAAPLQPHFAAIDPAEQPTILARHVASAVLEALASAKDPDARI